MFKIVQKRQKTQYFKFYRFLVFWPTRCVPVPDPKPHLRLVTSSVAYLEAFWPKKPIYYPKIVKEKRVQAPHRNAYFRAFWPTWCIGLAGWILIFSKNEYDFQNQHPKNVQKQLVLAKVWIMSPLSKEKQNKYSTYNFHKFLSKPIVRKRKYFISQDRKIFRPNFLSLKWSVQNFWSIDIW